MSQPAVASRSESYQVASEPLCLYEAELICS